MDDPRRAWLAKVTEDLRGRDPSTLRHTCADGFELDPVYFERDASIDSELPGQFPHRRGRTVLGPGPRGTAIRQEYRQREPEQLRSALEAAKVQGAAGAMVVMDFGLRAGTASGTATHGLVAGGPEAFQRALEGLDFDVWVDAGVCAHEVAHSISDASQVTVLASVLGVGLRRGGLPGSLDSAFDPLLALSKSGRANVGWLVDGAAHHDSGADDADELAAILSTGADLLRRGLARGISPERLAATMVVRVSLTPDLFAGICKLRATRWVWAKMLDACQIDDGSVRIHARSSEVTHTRRMPWNNLLRTTLEGFGASVGGADSLALLPFDASRGATSELGERLALNIQRMLADESGLGHVVDPAGGAYYVEARTERLARQAWSRFRDLERAGGLVAALESGAWQHRLQQSAELAAHAVSTGKRPLTGLSAFPVLEERPLPPRVDARPNLRSSALRAWKGEPWQIESAPVRARGAAFESMRDATATLDAPPCVFLASVGALAEHQARTDFAANFFASAGFDVHRSDGYDSLASGIDAFRSSGASIAVLCSSDAGYAAASRDWVDGLRGAGARDVFLAGRLRDELKDLPVTEIYRGCDQAGVLRDALRGLGVLS